MLYTHPSVPGKDVYRADIPEKFWNRIMDAKHTRENPDRVFNGITCLEWIKGTNGRKRPNGRRHIELGRPQIRIGDKVYLVARAVYAYFYGHAPAGLDVAHFCHNRLCVRPQHLYVTTRLDNTLELLAREHSVHPRTIRMIKAAVAGLCEGQPLTAADEARIAHALRTGEYSVEGDRVILPDWVFMAEVRIEKTQDPDAIPF